MGANEIKKEKDVGRGNERGQKEIKGKERMKKELKKKRKRNLGKDRKVGCGIWEVKGEGEKRKQKNQKEGEVERKLRV